MNNSNLAEKKSKKEERISGLEFYWTGHPFVDAGLTAILLIAGKSKPDEICVKDVERAIDFASELYATKEWSSSYLHGMIFPNNGIIMSNPSMLKNRSPEAISHKLRIILEKTKDTGTTSDAPTCIICGRNPAYTDKKVNRSVFPLLGTAEVTNYFHSANPKGADICAHCIFLTQLMPLVSYRLSRVLVIHAYPYELMLELSKEALNDVRRYKLASQARGFKRPENFLFHLVGELTRKIEKDEFWENASVTLYYFICNNQNQTIDIIHVPTPVLRFVAYANLVDRDGWKRIVSMSWRKQPIEAEFGNLEREERSAVYSKLLNYESILPYFYNPKEKKVNANWNLLAFYCKEVMGLDEKALEFIKRVGDAIVETLSLLPQNKMSKRVRMLETAERNLSQFASFFVRIEKDRQELKMSTPLMTFDDFARILTAYGEDINISWKTVKNLLLFRVYEKLHDKLVGLPESEEEEEYVFANGGGLE